MLPTTKSKLLLLPLILFSLFTFAGPTPGSWTEWGHWQQNPCFPQIKYRTKHNTSGSSGKHEWKVQFHNTFNEKIYFNFEMVPYEQRSQIESSGRTTHRTDLGANSQSPTGVHAHWTFLTTNSQAFVYINKLRFTTDAGPHADCGDVTSNKKSEKTNSSPSEPTSSTPSCYNCTPAQIAEKRQQAAAERAQKAADKKAVQEQERREAQELARQEQREQQIKQQRNNERRQMESDQAQINKIREQERQKEQERKRKQKLYQQRQEQTKQNMSDATELSAAAILLHLYLGKVLYSIKNSDGNGQYQDWSNRFNMRFGYGISNHTMFVNEKHITYGNNTSRVADVVTLNLNYGIEWSPLHSKHVGFSTFADVYAGHGFLFQNFKWGASAGIKTHLGPIGYNYRINSVEINHGNWIDADIIAKEKVKSVYGRHEMGLSYVSSTLGVDILYLLRNNNPVIDEDKISHGLRVEVYKPNALRFYVEMSEAPVILGRATSSVDSERVPSILKFGVLNNLSWFGNTYANNYNTKALAKHLQNKNTFISIGLKLQGGDITIGDGTQNVDTFQRTVSNVNIQGLIEHEFKIVDNMFLSVGGGLSAFRGFKGRRHNSGINTYNTFGQNRNINFSSFTFDIPLGIVYKTDPIADLNYSFWSSFKADIVVPLGYIYPYEKDEFGYSETIDEEELDGIKNSAYTILKVGIGLEYYINLSTKFRWGVFYEFAPSSIYKNDANYYPNGLALKAAISL